MHEKILRQLAGLMASTFNCPADSVTLDTTAFDIAGWDSLSHVYFIMAIERSFRIRLPLERTAELATVGDLVALLIDLTGESR